MILSRQSIICSVTDNENDSKKINKLTTQKPHNNSKPSTAHTHKHNINQLRLHMQTQSNWITTKLNSHIHKI